jgi:hypothetical protein
VPQVGAAAQGGHLVDDDLGPGPGHGLADRGRVQAIHRHRLGAHRAQPALAVWAAGTGGDLMAGRDELGDQALPDGTSRAGHEDPHNDSFRCPHQGVGGRLFHGRQLRRETPSPRDSAS